MRAHIARLIRFDQGMGRKRQIGRRSPLKCLGKLDSWGVKVRVAFLGVFVVNAAISGDSIGYVNTCNRLGGEELTIWNDVSHIE